MRDIAGKRDFNLPGGAMAVELAALEVGVAFRDAVIDGGVDRRHFGISVETMALWLESRCGLKSTIDL